MLQHSLYIHVRVTCYEYYLAAAVIPNEFAGSSSLPIFLDMLDCDGTEEDLLQCDSFLAPGIHDVMVCDNTNLVGVRCHGNYIQVSCYRVSFRRYLVR